MSVVSASAGQRPALAQRSGPTARRRSAAPRRRCRRCRRRGPCRRRRAPPSTLGGARRSASASSWQLFVHAHRIVQGAPRPTWQIVRRGQTRRRRRPGAAACRRAAARPVMIGSTRTRCASMLRTNSSSVTCVGMPKATGVLDLHRVVLARGWPSQSSGISRRRRSGWPSKTIAEEVVDLALVPVGVGPDRR